MALPKADRLLIERNMTNHPPDNATQAQMEAIRATYKRAAKIVLGEVPDCRERSLGLTNLEQSLMWVMAALARTNYDERNNGG